MRKVPLPPLPSQDQWYQNIFHRRRQMGKRVDNAHPDPPEALGRADGPVFPGHGREKAEGLPRPLSRPFSGSAWPGKAAIKEPVGSPARAAAKDKGISVFLPTIPMLESMELTEKATPPSSSRTPAPADGIKNKVIQRVSKEPAPVPRQKMDQQAPQEQAGPSALRAYQQDRGGPQQAEQQHVRGSGRKRPCFRFSITQLRRV